MEYKLELYDNAIDSLQHGLSHYIIYDNEPNVSDVKQAIMNLINSIDLLVLERLKRKDETLIYENTKNDKFGLGYKKTINAETAYKLIKGDIDKIDADEFKAYEILKVLRNSATHYSFAFGKDSENNIIFLLHYIARFLDNELGKKIEEVLNAEESKFYYRKIQHLDYGKVIQERIYAAIQSEINFLNYVEVKDGGTPVVADFSCVECDRQGVSIDERLGPYGVCVFCESVNNIESCSVCGEVFNADWDGLVVEEDALALCEYHASQLLSD